MTDQLRDRAIRLLWGRMRHRDIAILLGMELDDARRRARELGVARVRGCHRWTTRDERTLMRMVAQGATWGEIARTIGCTAEAARSREWAVRTRREEVASLAALSIGYELGRAQRRREDEHEQTQGHA